MYDNISLSLLYNRSFKEVVRISIKIPTPNDIHILHSGDSGHRYRSNNPQAPLQNKTEAKAINNMKNIFLHDFIFIDFIFYRMNYLISSLFGRILFIFSLIPYNP